MTNESSILLTNDGTSPVAWSTWWELPPDCCMDTTISTMMQKPGHFVKSSSGAVRLLQRCQAEYGWDIDTTKRILMAYKDFLFASSFLPSDHWLVPCPLVQQVWQLHILDTQNYASDCQFLMGRIVHFNDYLESDNDEGKDDSDVNTTTEESAQESFMRRRKHKRQMIQKTIKFICDKTNQESLDPKVWNYGSSAMDNSFISSGESQTARRHLPLNLKRDSSDSSSNNEDNNHNDENRNGNSKKMRLSSTKSAATVLRARSHPWNAHAHQSKRAPISVQIQFTSNSINCLEQKKQNTASNPSNDENVVNGTSIIARHSKLSSFQLENHAPLHRIFQQIAEAQELDRQCLQFTYRGQVLEGTETPHALSKYYGKEEEHRSSSGSSNSSGNGPVRQSLKPSSGSRVLKIDCSPVLSEC